MKRLGLYFHYIIVFVICQALTLCGNVTSVFAADVDNFTFESFTADYYISRNLDGTSNLHVHERLVALFPQYDVNHGIIRAIPYTNAGGANITATSIEAFNFTAQRNGEPANIYDIEEDEGNYIFTIRDVSDSSYVHGRQTYDLEYDFNNVILNYDSNKQVTWNPGSATFQELYWDTNGTGWRQPFQTLTANVHFLDGYDDLAGDVNCYVGYEGENIPNRCYIIKLADGYSFITEGLAPRENLTFSITLNAGTFKVNVFNNYALIILTAIVGALLLISLLIYLKLRSIYREKREFHKNRPAPPQYTSLKDFSVSEASLLTTKPTFSSKVAVLIDLAIRNKIELVKGNKKRFGGYKWTIHIKTTKGLTANEQIVLQLLNGGKVPADGEMLEVKNQRYSSTLQKLDRSFTIHAEQDLVKRGLRETKAVKGNAIMSKQTAFIVIICLILFFLMPIFLPMMDYRGIVVGHPVLTIVCIIEAILIIVLACLASREDGLYACHTIAGLEKVGYYDGLRLYMKMAETERIKFLQSAPNIDTSPEGIVKLHEKLLPYAILFKIEKSWLEELNHYYEINGSEHPTWYVGTGPFVFSDFNSFTSSTSASISSGSGSSSSSGSGGGGSSGGGGGGGGGGGC